MLDNICSSFLTIGPKTPPSDPQIQCPKHPGSLITHFCISNNCSEPYLCQQCRKIPNSTAKHEWVPAKTVLKGTHLSNSPQKHEPNYSPESVKAIANEIQTSLSKAEQEVAFMISQLRERAASYISFLNEKAQTLSDYSRQNQHLFVSNSPQKLPTQEIKRLIGLYNSMRGEGSKMLDIGPELMLRNFKRELEKMVSTFKEDYFKRLAESLAIVPIEFQKLRVGQVIKIPNSEGVLYEASDFIPKWNILAIGYRKGQQGSICLYDLGAQNVNAVIEDLHRKWINHVSWIDEKNLLVTCSNDTKIKVMAVRDKGKRLSHIATLIGHKSLVRAIKYIHEKDVLLSAGDDPDLKIWCMRTMKKLGVISTKEQINMDGSIAYIPSNGLVGVGFRSGHIRLYDLLKRTCIVEFKTGYTNFYTYTLQYLPKRQIILGRVKENTIKLWRFDEEKKKILSEKIITTKGVYPDCVIVNEDESQLLLTSRDTFLEAYDFETEKLVTINLSANLKKTNSLTLLKGYGKVSVCDYTSNSLCILEQSTNCILL